MAEKSRGVDKVKKHVGHEPSGQAFNVCLIQFHVFVYGMMHLLYVSLGVRSRH